MLKDDFAPQATGREYTERRVVFDPKHETPSLLPIPVANASSSWSADSFLVSHRYPLRPVQTAKTNRFLVVDCCSIRHHCVQWLISETFDCIVAAAAVVVVAVVVVALGPMPLHWDDAVACRVVAFVQSY